MNGFEFRRRLANLTQKQAADLIGVTNGAISLWETGKTVPGSHKLNKIAEVYGCEIADLFTDAK